MIFGPRSNKKRSRSITIHSGVAGDVGNIDWEGIKSDLDSIVPRGTQQIRALDKDDDAKFKRLVTRVRSVYESPDEYDKLQKMVVESFGKQADIKPGTVNAYFVGCLADSKIQPKGCNPLCAGAMPLAREAVGNNSFCEYPVFVAETVNGRSVITKMSTVEDMSKAIVYVDASSSDDFSGFTEEERSALSSQGVESVKLVNYKSDVITSDEWVPLSKTETRETGDYVVVASETSGWTRALMIFILALIVLFILYLIYTATRK